jgi:hypothetical protein
MHRMRRWLSLRECASVCVSDAGGGLNTQPLTAELAAASVQARASCAAAA